MKQAITTDQAPKGAVYSQAITGNGLIFVAGQIHLLPDGTLLQGSTADRFAQVMKNVTEILSAAGATLDDVVKVSIFVTDIAMVGEINEVYASYFTEPLPAREAVCVAALPLGATVEVSVIAAKG